jgi:alkanesulfonate monooxygenase SsuD/methylene tetrahydromethanopterin reductase-like flavin-dependent oxidoreductase (luciferase family)
MGRGLARREFEAFRGTMDESRGRFDEAAEMILRGLRTGYMQGDGPFYPQPRTEIRPRPTRGFEGRVYAVASSDDSVVSAARLDAHMVMFADRPWPLRMPAIQKHRELVREMHKTEARPPLLADFCVCTPTMDGAEVAARQYMGKFVESNFYHYELLGPHFTTVKGYDAYAQKIAMAREIGMDGIVSAFMEAAVWGPPDRILRKLEERRTIVGDFELATSFRFGGTPFDLAESGLRLYAKEVMPVVRSWTKAGPAAVTSGRDRTPRGASRAG